MRTIELATALLLAVSLSSFASEPSVADARTMSVGGWELQSAVVPPNKKPQCKSGRLIVEADSTILGHSAAEEIPKAFAYRDFGRTSGITGYASLPALEDGANYKYLSNDHDLLAANDGNLYFFVACFSVAPLSPKPSWWSATYRGDFGPGTRSIVLVFRSRDCGESWEPVAELDTAVLFNGKCGNPQGPKTIVNGQVRWDAGGADGNLTRYSAAQDVFYSTCSCVGNEIAATNPVDLGAKIDRTVIATYRDDGGRTPASAEERRAKWTQIADVPSAHWRMDLATVGRRLVLSTTWGENPVLRPIPGGQWHVDTLWKQAPDGRGPLGLGNWDGFDSQPANQYTDRWFAHTVVSRSPSGKKLVMAVPDDIRTTKSAALPVLNGYRTYLFDPATETYQTLPPVYPLTLHPGDFIFHLTIIDPGSGPVLMYWLDFDMTKKKTLVRGRLLVSDTESYDFVIERAGGAPAPESLAGFVSRGDYWGAGGFVEQDPLETRYVYVPTWVRADGATAYARIDVTQQMLLGLKVQTVNPAPQSAMIVNPATAAMRLRARRDIERYKELPRRRE
jgi:hypothetical protein